MNKATNKSSKRYLPIVPSRAMRKTVAGDIAVMIPQDYVSCCDRWYKGWRHYITPPSWDHKLETKADWDDESCYKIEQKWSTAARMEKIKRPKTVESAHEKAKRRCSGRGD